MDNKKFNTGIVLILCTNFDGLGWILHFCKGNKIERSEESKWLRIAANRDPILILESLRIMRENGELEDNEGRILPGRILAIAVKHQGQLSDDDPMMSILALEANSMTTPFFDGPAAEEWAEKFYHRYMESSEQ